METEFRGIRRRNVELCSRSRGSIKREGSESEGRRNRGNERYGEVTVDLGGGK